MEKDVYDIEFFINRHNQEETLLMNINCATTDKRIYSDTYYFTERFGNTHVCQIFNTSDVNAVKAKLEELGIDTVNGKYWIGLTKDDYNRLFMYAKIVGDVKIR